MSDRCMGACCEDIGLLISPDFLRKSYYNWLSNGKLKVRMSETSKHPSYSDNVMLEDIYLFFPMLVFIKENYIYPESGKKKDEKIYHYSCKHFNKKERLCTIYDCRPRMYITYPNDKPCLNKKCKWKKQLIDRKIYLKRLLIEKKRKPEAPKLKRGKL